MNQRWQRMVGDVISHAVPEGGNVALCGKRSGAWIGASDRDTRDPLCLTTLARGIDANGKPKRPPQQLSDEQFETLAALSLAYPAGLALTGSSPSVLRWLVDERVAVRRLEARGTRWVITQTGMAIKAAGAY